MVCFFLWVAGFGLQGAGDGLENSAAALAKLLSVNRFEEDGFLRDVTVVRENNDVVFWVKEVTAGGAGAMTEKKYIACSTIEQVRIVPRGDLFGLLIQYRGSASMTYADDMQHMATAWFGDLSDSDARQALQLLESIREAVKKP